MKEISSLKITEKKSRFYAHIYRIDRIEDVKNILRSHRRMYKKANHHCYAVRWVTENTEHAMEFWKDDGEVGHPGKILLEVLSKHDLTNHILIVSRIFGGVKLGIGGVSRIFRKAGELSVQQIHSSA